MKKILLCLIIPFGTGQAETIPVNPEHPEDYTLEQVVMLSRHGIRAPLIGYGSALAQATPQTWPKWHTEAGHLTPKGAKLEQLFARYLRTWLHDNGLIAGKACPTDEVLIYTNSLPRTIESGKSFADGAFPGCSTDIRYLEQVGTMDNTFNPIIRSKTDKAFIDKAQRSLDEMLGDGGFAKLNQHMQHNYAVLEKVLDYTHTPACTEEQHCDLSAKANTLTLAQGKEAKTSGPLRLGTGAGDSFILQYYEGFPDKEVAWGKIQTPEDWQAIADIKNTYTDVLFTPPVIAKEAATPLVRFIQNAFVDHGYPHPLLEKARNAKLTLLVGHDSNAASVLSLLKAAPYQLPGQYEKTPISGKIAFQRWHDNRHDKDLIKIEYLYQTGEQLRHATMLDNDHPPGRVTLQLAGCPADAEGFCPLEQFDRAINAALAP